MKRNVIAAAASTAVTLTTLFGPLTALAEGSAEDEKYNVTFDSRDEWLEKVAEARKAEDKALEELTKTKAERAAAYTRRETLENELADLKNRQVELEAELKLATNPVAKASAQEALNAAEAELKNVQENEHMVQDQLIHTYMDKAAADLEKAEKQIQEAQFEKTAQENIRTARKAEIDHTNQLLADTRVQEELTNSKELRASAQKDLDAADEIYQKSLEQYQVLEKAEKEAYDAMEAARLANEESLKAWEDAEEADSKAQLAWLDARARLELTEFQLANPVTLEEIRTDSKAQKEEAAARIEESQERQGIHEQDAKEAEAAANKEQAKLDELTAAQEKATQEMQEAYAASETAHEAYHSQLVERKKIEGSVQKYEAEIKEREAEIKSLDNLIAIREKELKDYEQEYADILKKNELVHSKEELEIELRELDFLIEQGSLGFFREIDATETFKYFTDAYYANTSRYSGQNGQLSTTAASVYYKETRLGQEGDATSLENMKKAIEMIGMGNQLRTSDTGRNGASLNLNALQVSPSLMAMAQIATNAGIRKENHTGLFFPEVGENLSWNYQNPYIGWFEDERKSYVENGWSHVDGTQANGLIPTGHYENIIYPKYTVTGGAVNQYSKYGGAHSGNGHGQLFMTSSGDDSHVMSYGEFKSKFDAYYKKTIGRRNEIQEKLAEILYLEKVSLEEEEAARKNVKAAEEHLQTRKDDKQKAEQKIKDLQKEIDATAEKLTKKDEDIEKAKKTQEEATANYHTKDEELNRIYHEHLDQQTIYNEARSIYEEALNKVQNEAKVQENWQQYLDLIESEQYEQAYAVRMTNVETENKRALEDAAQREQEKQETVKAKEAARDTNKKNNEAYLDAMSAHEKAYETMMAAAPEHQIAAENQKAASDIYDLAAQRVSRAEVYLDQQKKIIENAQKDVDEADRHLEEIEENLKVYNKDLVRFTTAHTNWQVVHDHNMLRLASAYYDENGKLVSAYPDGDSYLSDHLVELDEAQQELLDRIQTDYKAATTEAENKVEKARETFHDFSDENIAELKTEIKEVSGQAEKKTQELSRSSADLSGLDEAVAKAEKKYDDAKDYNAYIKRLRYDPDEALFSTKSDSGLKGMVVLRNYTAKPPEGLYVDIAEVTEPTSYTFEGNPDYKVYDIELKDANGKIYDAEGPQKVYWIQFEIPREFEGHDLEIYQVHEDKKQGEEDKFTLEQMGAGYVYSTRMIRWDADELGRFAVVDKGVSRGGVQARFDAVDNSGHNHGTISISGADGQIPEGVYAKVQEKTKHDSYSVKGAKGYKVYTIELLDADGKVYEAQGDHVTYSIQLPIPGDYENRTVEVHGVRNAGIQVQDGSVAAPELDKMDVSYNYETKLLSWDSPQLGEFVIADMSGAPAGGSGEGDGGQGSGQQGSGSGQQEKKSNTSTTNNSKNTTTTKSANTGLQLRFGLWFAGLFASTGAAAAVLKKMRKDE